MNNVNSEDSVSLLNALNDFALTVLAPLPNNSYFLSQWYKFKPLLASDSYDPVKIQAFISSLDAELPLASSKRPPLSNRNLLDQQLESSKDNIQLIQGSSPVDGDSMYKGDASYEGNRRSGNSENSNSTFTPNSLSGCNGVQDQVQIKEKVAELSTKPEVQIDQFKVEKAGLRSSDEGHSFQRDGVISLQNSMSKENPIQKPRYASEYGFSSNNQGNGFDNRLESVNNKKNSTNFEDKPGLVIRVNSEKTLEPENRAVQRDGDNSHPESPAHQITNHKKEANASRKNRSLTALEYIANTLNKPYSAVSNYSVYTKFSVSETNLGPSTFYYSFIISYFLHLLSDRSTSLILSSIYEKVVIRKVRLSFYLNSEHLYESLTTSLKTLINEKISRSVSTKALQELFLERFYDDISFREGLVAVVKELLIEYIATLDIKTFTKMFGEINFEKLKSIIRSQESEPTEDMISVFPYFTEGDIEIHYIQSDKIEIVLYQQKEHKTFGQPLFPLICAKFPNETKKKIYHALLVEEQTEALEEFVSAKNSNHAENQDMKGTVYMSMDSNSNSKSSEEVTKELEFYTPLNDFKKGGKIESRNNSKHKGSKKRIKQKTNINRDFLLTKIKDLTLIMDKHSEKLGSFSKKPNYLETYDNQLNSPAYEAVPYEIALTNIRRRQQVAPQTQPISSFNPNNTSQRPSSTLSSGVSRNVQQGYNSGGSASKPYNLHVDTYLGRTRGSKDSRNTTNGSKNLEYASLSPARHSNRVLSSNNSSKCDRFQSTKEFIKNAFPSRNDSFPKEGSLDTKKGKDGLSTISAISKAGGSYLNKAYSAGLPGLSSRHGQNTQRSSPSRSGRKDRNREKENFNLSSASIRSPPQKPGLSYYQREAALTRAEKEASAL